MTNSQLYVPARTLAKRRRMLLVICSPVLVVLLIIAGFLTIKAHQKPPAASIASVPAGASMDAALKSIPPAVFDKVGTGMGIKAMAAAPGPADPVLVDGKPRVLYVGAEYCPFCAGERWAVVAALSRFGTFSHLGLIKSTAADVYPGTATLSFHGATYTSSLIYFTGVETTTNISIGNGQFAPLDVLSAADKQTDKALNPEGFIPFVDFGGRRVIAGASYDVGSLQGMSQEQIIKAMYDPSTEVSKRVLGAANMMTAALCVLTKGQPASVCTSTAVSSQAPPA